MTFIEQACHRQVMGIWHRRSLFRSTPEKIIALASQYFETSGARPTSSASLLLFSGMAAAGATLYRRKAPVLAELKRELVAEPRAFGSKIMKLGAKSRDELRLHQEIVSRFLVARVR